MGCGRCFQLQQEGRWGKNWGWTCLTWVCALLLSVITTGRLSFGETQNE